MLKWLKKIDDKFLKFEKEHYYIATLSRHFAYWAWFLFGLYVGYRMWG